MSDVNLMKLSALFTFFIMDTRAEDTRLVDTRVELTRVNGVRRKGGMFLKDGQKGGSFLNERGGGSHDAHFKMDAGVEPSIVLNDELVINL